MRLTILKTFILPILVMLVYTGCGESYEASLEELSERSSADLSAGANLFASKGCAGCHGVDGGTSALGVSRIIVDIRSERDVQNALYALRAQVPRRDPIMLNEAKDLGDQEIIDLSTYIFFQRH